MAGLQCYSRIALRLHVIAHVCVLAAKGQMRVHMVAAPVIMVRATAQPHQAQAKIARRVCQCDQCHR